MRLNNSILVKNACVIFIVLASCWQFSSGSYIYVKAQLAQYLLNNAWSKTLQGNYKVKPWHWADTYPVANIIFVRFDKEYIVLAGGTGRTMAFGPAHISSTPLPGRKSNSVIIGHRDTHFTVLKDLKPGDEVTVQTQDKNLRYKVENTFIVDEKQSEVMQNHGSELLTLITCYPFDAIKAGGSLRYIVQAQPI